MAKNTEVEELKQKIAQLTEAHAQQIRGLNQEIVQLKNEIAAGKPKELKALRDKNDKDVTEISTLRRRVRELENK